MYLIIFLFVIFIIYNLFNNQKEYFQPKLTILGSVSLPNNKENQYIFNQILYLSHNLPSYHLLSTNAVGGLIGYLLNNITQKDQLTTYTSKELHIPLNKDYKIKTFNTDQDFENALINDGDAYLILPGGIGTLYELILILYRMSEKGVNKKIYLLNSGGFYDNILNHLNKIREKGLLRGDVGKRINDNLIVESNIYNLLKSL